VRTIRCIVILSLLAAICGVVQGLLMGFPDLESPPDQWGLSLDAALARGSLLWVDGRSEDDYTEGHYPGAIHLSLDDWDTGFSQILQDWEPGMVLVVYCDGEGCESSREMARKLRQDFGDEEIFWLVGGWPVLKEKAAGL
jgi:rhodanese-related sulfurtransferase